MEALRILAIVAAAATAIVLALGIAGFGKGSDFNRKHANKLMRLRLALQFVAVLLVLGYIYLRQQGGQ